MAAGPVQRRKTWPKGGPKYRWIVSPGFPAGESRDDPVRSASFKHNLRTHYLIQRNMAVTPSLSWITRYRSRADTSRQYTETNDTALPRPCREHAAQPHIRDPSFRNAPRPRTLASNGPISTSVRVNLENKEVDMDEDSDVRMPQDPTSRLFLFAGSFGLVASLVGSGLIMAAASF